jgi:hypothetical protein
MTRWMMALGVGVALAMSAPVGMGEAAAKKKVTHNQCTYKNLAGQSQTWKCKLDEKCCFDGFLAKGTCLPKSGVCL